MTKISPLALSLLAGALFAIYGANVSTSSAIHVLMMPMVVTR